MTPDLQRIVEALKACRGDHITSFSVANKEPAKVWRVSDDSDQAPPVFIGTLDECAAYIDARCAEAMVRAIREPGEAAIEAAERGHWKGDFVNQWARACDAILGEAQP